jgi:hypothetical protein
VELARNGGGGLGFEIEAAEGPKPMTLTVHFARREDYDAAVRAFRGKDAVSRTDALIRAWRCRR